MGKTHGIKYTQRERERERERDLRIKVHDYPFTPMLIDFDTGLRNTAERNTQTHKGFYMYIEEAFT